MTIAADLRRRARGAWTVALSLVVLACAPVHDPDGQATPLGPAEFRTLLEELARAWESQDPDAAVDLFTRDAAYLQPPDVQFFAGHSQLRSYFGAVGAGTRMEWHHVWFDSVSQFGAGEFSFGAAERVSATHGVAIIQLKGGRIASWHEYLQTGPSSRADFLSPEGKEWKWHIGNYP
jgi:hypothetical protein